jgi:hypothetical protein
MTTQTTPTKPLDLDPTILHSPDAVRKWKADSADYFQALRDIEQTALDKEQAVTAHANRTLDENEYFQLAVKRKKEQDDKQAEHAAIQKAKELAAIYFAMSSPPVADIMENNEYRFLASVVNFANRGYTLGDNGILHFGMGLFHCQLDAPVVAKKAGSK